MAYHYIKEIEWQIGDRLVTEDEFIEHLNKKYNPDYKKQSGAEAPKSKQFEGDCLMY